MQSASYCGFTKKLKCLNRFDIFGSSLTVFEESCAVITSGDLATTQEIVLAWNTDLDRGFANATLTVNGLGISLTADMPSDWFGWQRMTHLFFTVGDTDTAADTEVVLNGLSVRNSEEFAVGCSGSWIDDDTCVVATRHVAVTMVSRKYVIANGNPESCRDFGIIVSTFD